MDFKLLTICATVLFIVWRILVCLSDIFDCRSINLRILFNKLAFHFECSNRFKQAQIDVLKNQNKLLKEQNKLLERLIDKHESI